MRDFKENDTCIDAFKNLYIEQRNNKFYISPCCVSNTVESDSIDFNHSYLEKIRGAWKKNIFPKECKVCKINENNNLMSRRTGSNTWYTDHNLYNTEINLTRLDFWVGDTCNLACAICGPQFSSKWKQEINVPVEFKKANFNESWRKLDLTNIKFIYFNGGEPLLSKEHVLLLEQITNPEEVHLCYNTNGTILPDEKLLKLWEKFKLVQIYFSIDDIEERFEYQRYPAKWNSVVENLNWFIAHAPVNCIFAVTTALSLLNMGNLENLKIWLNNNFYQNRLSDPIAQIIQTASGVFEISSADIRKKEILKFLDDCDSRRKTNWRKTLPELVKFLEC